MADAKKCDACGKYYDKNEKFKGEGGCAIQEVRTLTRRGWAESYDLCDECLEFVLEFLNEIGGDPI